MVRPVFQRSLDPHLAAAQSFASDVHAHLRENITLADQKAGVLFAAIMGLVAYLQSVGLVRHWGDPRTWHVVDGVVGLAFVCLGIGAGQALFVVWPRRSRTAQGLVYWEAIADHHGPAAYADAVLTTEPAALTQALVQNCYDLAHICRRKYRALRVALWATGLGTGMALAAWAMSPALPIA